MAIYTPRGLKIRLPIEYAFTLMARLYPKVDAFKVLKMAEGLDLLPKSLTFVVGMVCFVLEAEPIQIGLYTLAAALVGKLLILRGLFIVPGLPTLGVLYSYLSGFGILLLALLSVGLWKVGWKGLVAFFAAKGIAAVLNGLLEFSKAKEANRRIGEPVTDAEICFFNAYRLYASEAGVTTDLNVSDEEMGTGSWKQTFDDLASKWPDVVRRFTPN